MTILFIASSSPSLLLTKHAANGPVEEPAVEVNVENERFTVVVKTLNLEISHCHLADYVKELH